jgi:hypothetical protein
MAFPLALGAYRLAVIDPTGARDGGAERGHGD